MKALLLAATSSLALAGAALAQTATPVPAPETAAGAAAHDAAVAVDNAAAAAGEAAHDAATAASDAAAAAGDAAKDAAHKAEDAAEKAGEAAEHAVTGATTTTETTTTFPATTTETAPAATDAAAPAAVVVAPDVQAPVMSAENPGMLGSYIMNRRIWTTNQPSSTAWADGALTERPAEWTDIAKVDDIVVDPEGNIQGYVADIGGFLGLGAKSVLLGKDALHFVKIGDDAFFATNFTKEELQALPDFDRNTVMK